MTTKRGRSERISFILPDGENEIEIEREPLPDCVRVTLHLPSSSVELSAKIPADVAERIGEALIKAAKLSPR